MAQLTVNGRALTHNAEPDTPLLWVLREQLGLTGTKYVLRHCTVRRLHGACRRQPGAQLCAARFCSGRRDEDHHHRGLVT